MRRRSPARRFSVRAYRNLDDLYRVNHPRASATVVQMEAQSMLILSGRYLGFLPRHIGDGFAARGLMRALRPESTASTASISRPCVSARQTRRCSGHSCRN